MQKNKVKKILFITHSYAMTGGAEDEFERLLKYFASKKDLYEVHGLFPKGERSVIYASYCTRFGYYKYGHLPVIYESILSYIKYNIKSIIQIFQVIKFAYGQKYDLAVVNVVVLLWPIIAVKLLFIKVIVFVREDIYPVSLRHFIYKLLSLICSYIIPNSYTKLEDFKKVTKIKNIQKIYPAIEEIDVPEIDGLKEKIGIELFNKLSIKKRFRFINPARILVKKNQLLILEALNEIKKISQDFLPQIVFLGYYDVHSAYMKSLLKFINDNDLQEYCVFLGELSKDYLYKVYQMVDSVILTSLSEGMPLVMVEAFRFRKPFISTKVGGIPEIILDRRNGILVDFDPKQVCSSMLDLVKDSEMYTLIQQNAYEIYEKNFKLDLALKSTEEIFQTVLNSSK